MDKKKSIEALQFLATELSNGAFVHLAQGKYFESLGFKKLGEKYTGHYQEEMQWVEKFMARILDLGGEVKVEDRKGREIVKAPLDYVKADLAIQEKGVEMLYGCVANVCGDPTTYDLLKAYLADEEEDLYWSQEQVEMAQMIGEQNWLVKQL
jgi:bacterioferritin